MTLLHRIVGEREAKIVVGGFKLTRVDREPVSRCVSIVVDNEVNDLLLGDPVFVD